MWPPLEGLGLGFGSLISGLGFLPVSSVLKLVRTKAIKVFNSDSVSTSPLFDVGYQQNGATCHKYSHFVSALCDPVLDGFARSSQMFWVGRVHVVRRRKGNICVH